MVRLWMICAGAMALLAIGASDASAQTACSREIGAAKAKALVSQCKKATTDGGESGVCYADNTCENIRNEIRDACRAYKFFKRETFEFCGPYINDMPQEAD